MAKQRFNSKDKQVLAGKAATPQLPDAQLQRFLQQKKYRQAIEEIKRLHRIHPDLALPVSESELWLKQGIQEFDQKRWKDAEASLKRALELGQKGEVHYWLSRCLITAKRDDEALALLRSAFDEGSLPKDYRICYLKVLLLKGDFATVEQLITTKAKQWPAAHLHWARGVLALQKGELDTALVAFQKIKKPLTPGDLPEGWQVYVYQLQEAWEQSATLMGVRRYGQFFSAWKVPQKHPLLKQLLLYQQAKTGNPPLEREDLQQQEPSLRDVVEALTIVQMVEQGNPHDAAHVLLHTGASLLNLPFNLGHSAMNAAFPELESLRPTLLLLAGQQAVGQGELDCAEQFFKPLVDDKAFRNPSFNPKLAANAAFILKQNGSFHECQQLLGRLIHWLEDNARKQPEKWPERSLKTTLSRLHCEIADCWMASQRPRQAKEELQRAERLDATSPEVIGRRGLLAIVEKRLQDAVPLLTQALEQGCAYRDVYVGLLDTLEKLGDRSTRTEIRRKFGKRFGDLDADIEELPVWLDALSTQIYDVFESVIENAQEKHPAVQACQIFIDTVNGPQTASTGRVPIDQAVATAQWDGLLSGLSGEQQVETLQAIALTLTLFAKREKGIVGLINQFIQKLAALKGTEPTATEAHLITLAVKENNADKLRVPLQRYLSSQPQPGNALAALQLKIRKFGTIYGMRPLIDEALSREPQNPLLLLAKATTWIVDSQPYEEFREAGFDLARRLQDSKALQAFREEEAFVEQQHVNSALPTPEALENFGLGDIENMIETLIRQTLRGKVPPAELERVMPEMKAMMLNQMMNMEDEDDFSELPDLEALLGRKPPRKRKRRGFFDL